jgi:outer membrane protein
MKFRLASVAFIVSLLAAGPAEADTRVAVIDMQRAVMQTEDGLRAAANLKKLFESKQQELNRKQVELGKQHDEIEKQSKVLSKEALAKRVDDWQKQMTDLQSVYMEYNKELDKKRQEITDPIVEKVYTIVKRLATTENFDIVVDKQAVPYVRGDLDLTDKCIQIYNSGGASIPPSTAPAPAPGPVAPAPAPAHP